MGSPEGRGKEKRTGMAVAWGSPDCKHWTTAQGFQKMTEGMGTFGDQQTQKAIWASQEAEEALYAVFDAFKKARKKDPKFQYAMEQPRGQK
jgi:hypothetical protein